MRFTIHVTFPDNARMRLRAALRMMGGESIVISEAKEQATPAKKDNVPTCPMAVAVAVLFGRKPEQEWNETEITIFKAARKRRAITIESMAIMTTYYHAERKKGSDPQTGGIHRRDLLTFLRNVDGENDRANAHASSRRKGASRGEWLPSMVQPPLLVAMPEPTREEIEQEKKRISQ